MISGRGLESRPIVGKWVSDLREICGSPLTQTLEKGANNGERKFMTNECNNRETVSFESKISTLNNQFRKNT